MNISNARQLLCFLLLAGTSYAWAADPAGTKCGDLLKMHRRREAVKGKVLGIDNAGAADGVRGDIVRYADTRAGKLRDVQ